MVVEPVGAGVAVWSSARWRRLAESWLDERLAAAGLARTGPVRQRRVRPWATVLTAPTTAEPVWMKAAAPGTAFEAGLYELLHDVVPDRVLTPIATDPARGWLLLPDGGTPLGERAEGAALVEAMVPVLQQYGQLQRDLAPHVDRMLTLGVVDMRAGVLPERFDAAVAAVTPYATRRASDTDRERFQAVTRLRPAVVRWSAELTAAPGAASIDHNDLHPWNVLPRGDGGGARFYDWGDAVVAHPFASALVCLAVLRDTLGGGPADGRVLRARDAYLEVFGDLAPRAELVRTLELACRLGEIARALTWHRALAAGVSDQAGSTTATSADAGAGAGPGAHVDVGAGAGVGLDVDPDAFADAPLHHLTSLLDHPSLDG